MIHDKLTLIAEMAKYPAGSVLRITDARGVKMSRCMEHTGSNGLLKELLDYGVVVELADRPCVLCEPTWSVHVDELTSAGDWAR